MAENYLYKSICIDFKYKHSLTIELREEHGATRKSESPTHVKDFVCGSPLRSDPIEQGLGGGLVGS